ncbi:DNA terminase, large subunit [Aeromonas phage AerS_266]|nr:DNA terminase, large subunit [Aeromonas phage AerS_266]
MEDDHKLNIAKTILKHLNLDYTKLPEYLMDDKNKRHFLESPDDRVLAHYDEESLWTLKTVRFLKDFSRFGAGIHKETNNRSFLRTAELFRQMGIKNYYFHLQLNNPLLANVDPWDPNLTDEQKSMILVECNQNVWYCVREIIKIDGRRFRANRAVISFIWSCLNHLNTLILMPRQSGKLQCWYSKILYPDGVWKRIRDVRVGDEVMAWDGTKTCVTALYPQGMQPVYKITFVDGRTAMAGPEHLWTVWDAGKGRRGKWRTLDTLEAMERVKELKNSNAKNHLSIPLVLPDQVSSHKPFKIHPYLVGVLIGDGLLSSGNVGYCKPDLDLFNRVKDLLPAGYQLKMGVNGKTVSITKADDHDSTKHINIREELSNIGLLGSTWSTKRIPEVYFAGSHAQRLALLQGLMDTDGTAEKKGNTYYSTSNKELSKDVQKLAWSLGHICHVTSRDEPKYTYKGETRVGAKAYRVNIRSKEPWLLFRDPKRISRVKDCIRGAKFNSKLAIYDIQKLPEIADSFCIEIDHPDHLYVTDNYVVTHNTVGMQVMAFIMQYLIGRGFRAGLITLAASNRMQFVNAIKKIRSGVPDYLINMTYKDNDAGNILTYQAFGESEKNTFEVRVPSGGEDGAENVARGSTFESLSVDEPAWMKYIENILNGAGPSTLTAQKNAREKGIPYYTAKATTPNSILKEEGRYMYDEMMHSTEWREVFFDSYSESHLVQRVIKASPVSTTSPKICMQFNHLQLGFGKDWVKETMDKLGLSLGKAKIDLLMMWTEEGVRKVFDDKTRELLSNGKAEPIWNEEIADTGLFMDWFITEGKLNEYINDPNEFLLLGVDTSDAIDRDACTVVIRRLKTGENLGVGRYPLAFLDDVTKVLLNLLTRMENSLLIIERNRAAHMIDTLLLTLPSLGIDPFKRIFNDIYQDPVKYKTEYKDIHEVHFNFRTKEFYLKYKGRFGFQTNSTTRNQMFNFILEAVSVTGSGIRYGHLIDELIRLEKDNDGRIDHSSKGHDDLVIAWLLTYWFIKLGYNKTLYGIPQGHTLTEVKTLMDDPDKPHYSKDQMELFIRIKERIEELRKELENTENDMLAERIEMEIKKLGDYIPKELRKTVTVDEIIANAQLERSKQRTNGRMSRFSYR